MRYFAKRLTEASTWAGLALAVSQGARAWATKDPVAACAAIGGVVAILVPEKQPA